MIRRSVLVLMSTIASLLALAGPASASHGAPHGRGGSSDASESDTGGGGGGGCVIFLGERDYGILVQLGVVPLSARGTTKATPTG